MQVIRGTDNYIIITDNLQLVSKVIEKISTIKIPHKDYRFVPLEN